MLQSMGSATGQTCLATTSGTAAAKSTAASGFTWCQRTFETTLTGTPPDQLPDAAELLKPTADASQSTVGSATDCPLTDCTATQNLLNGGGVLGKQTFTAANGKIEITETSAKFKKTDAANSATSAKQGLQAAHYFLKELKDSDTQTKSDAGNKTANDIIKDLNFKEYLKKVLVAETLPDNSVIDTIYGKDTDDFRKAFWGHVEETVIPKEATGRTKDAKLGAINNLKELHLAAIYYQTQTWDKLAEKAETVKKLQDKSEKKDLKTAETTCNAAKDDREACENLKDKGCFFNSKREDGKTVS
ncbi:Trypanosome variant surface glycoprotein (A-type), putative [Trypanosoma equiperdum]|uniref:Trypanosome variant surface glycoprotein (A-type), putative n=1 Tax=Trypanosoma equiperdum TaxID=5694 RepID=A0A1G4IEJ9_TRYEQ|nr:Trypanosome variant surface glycoprotein (A-type), putative [Trypanosoma equiperdum]